MSEGWKLIVNTPGGPDAIVRAPLGPVEPGPGEVRIANRAVGLNFIDTYHRSGLYPLPVPFGLGTEGAGVVEALGPGVTDLTVGGRVAYLIPSGGSYATHVVVKADRVTPLPDAVSDDIAAASLLKGLTGWMLAEPCGEAKPGDSALVLAAAGGVGSILVQWLKAIGVTVIAHAGSAEKADIAKGLGADHALSVPFDQLAGEVRALTGGRGVDIVYDGIGAASWDAVLAATAPCGLILNYGNASGPTPPVAPLTLAQAGSLFLGRPRLFDWLGDARTFRAAAGRLFDMIATGKVRVTVGQRFALADAADAHRALEERRTTGSTVLMP